MPVPSELISSVEQNIKKRILIVDDDKSMVDSIVRTLKRENKYDLEVAYDGFEAGQKFAEYKPDLITVDLRMPGLDGYQLCSKIRENIQNKMVKILIISGVVKYKNIEKVLSLGANDYLLKPFNSTELKTKIDKLLSS